jgi:hypothetical protein
MWLSTTPAEQNHQRRPMPERHAMKVLTTRSGIFPQIFKEPFTRKHANKTNKHLHLIQHETRIKQLEIIGTSRIFKQSHYLSRA